MADQRTVGHEGAFNIVTGDDAKHPITDFSANYSVREDWIEITNLPVTGTLTVWLGQVVRGDVDFKSGDTNIYVCYDHVRFERGTDGGDDQGEASIEHVITDTTVDEGLTHTDRLVIGDPPFTVARGGMRLSDGSTAAGSWKRNAAASAVPHTEMVATERLYNNRESRRILRMTTPTLVSGISPVTALEYDGARFWPVMMEIYRPSGVTTFQAVEILDDTSVVTTDTNSEAASGAFFGGSTQQIYSAIAPRIVGLESLAVTTTTAIISAGSQTSMTINTTYRGVAVAANTWLDEGVFRIVDINTGDFEDLTVDGNYDGLGTINFDANSFDHEYGTGSYVFRDDNVRGVVKIEGGEVTIDDTGIRVLTSLSKSNPNTIRGVDDVENPTHEDFAIYADGTFDITYFQSDDNDIVLRTNVGSGHAPSLSLAASGHAVINAQAPNANIRLLKATIIGSDTTPATSALLELSSTTAALLVSRMTTTQRNALTASNGMIIYNTTTTQLEAYENGAWGAFGGGTGDFSGPASSTDEAIVRFDGTGGKTGQDSGITIDDNNKMQFGNSNGSTTHFLSFGALNRLLLWYNNSTNEGIIRVANAADDLKLQHGTNTRIEIDSTGIGRFGVTPAAQQAHIADADTSHNLSATYSDTEVEAALDALATKINAIIAVFETFGDTATS